MPRLLLACLLALLWSPPVAAQPLRVGSKNFTEQLVVAEILAQTAESLGVAVERRLNLGGTLIAHRALTTGQIDLYPEYTGTGLIAVLRRPPESGQQAVLATVREEYARRFGLDWLRPTGVDNGNVLLMRAPRARALELATLSDLARVAGGLTLAAGNEFAGRFDGLPGLRQVYGLQFGRFRQFASLGLRYAALRHGQADVANGYATDWQIDDGAYVALADDRGLFPPYALAVVARPEALAAHPRLRAALEAVGDRLDNATMRALNRQVERDGDEPRDVARRFLAALPP